MGWRGYIDETRETVFFWSQKAACTTLFSFLADNIEPRPPAKKFFHIHSEPWYICREALARGFQSAILVRHPVSRAISAYMNKFCVYQGRPLRTRRDLEPFARDLHDLWCRRSGHDRPLADNLITFEEFLATIADMIAHRPEPQSPEQQQCPINGHWEGQMPPFLAEEGYVHDHVIHVERLDTELGHLARRLGMIYHPQVLNRTETKADSAPDYLGRRPARAVAGMTFGPANFITPGTLARLHRIYALDFESFGYPVKPEG